MKINVWEQSSERSSLYREIWAVEQSQSVFQLREKKKKV